MPSWSPPKGDTYYSVCLSCTNFGSLFGTFLEKHWQFHCHQSSIALDESVNSTSWAKNASSKGSRKLLCALIYSNSVNYKKIEIVAGRRKDTNRITYRQQLTFPTATYWTVLNGQNFRASLELSHIRTSLMIDKSERHFNLQLYKSQLSVLDVMA